MPATKVGKEGDEGICEEELIPVEANDSQGSSFGMLQILQWAGVSWS